MPTQTGALVAALFVGALVLFWKRSPSEREDVEEMAYSEVETAILLHLWEEGNDVPSNIADARGPHRNSIVRSAKDLESEGLIVNKGRGVYRLTEKGKDVAERLFEIESISTGSDGDGETDRDN